MSRINSNTSSTQAIRQLVADHSDLVTRLERLSTGLRIKRGKDDPAGLIASDSLRSELSGINQVIEQIAVLSGQSGGLQACQLETDINTQQVAAENVQASEAAVRDTDFATEVAKLTRAQILVQTTTQFLSIANQPPQSVLVLLR